MKLPAIIISDPHFTASPNDEYRWGLWPWLTHEIREEGAKTLLILGDLTDAKDYHPAELVNRLTAAIVGVPVEQVIILAGNHDWLKQGGVFFKFLQCIQGSRIRVITEPTEILGPAEDPACMFLPYTKNPARDWKDWDFSHFDFLFMHQTAPGSVASNGQKMEGDEMPELNAGKVYSGDIHVPQVIGKIEYVGSPYHVHFGDNFKPRCLVIDKKRKAYDLHFPTIARRAVSVWSVEELRRLKLEKDDQIKVTINLEASEVHQWHQIRREAVEWVRDQGAHLHGMKLVTERSQERLGGSKQAPVRQSPEDSIYRYVVGQELGGDLLEAGYDILEGGRK